MKLNLFFKTLLMFAFIIFILNAIMVLGASKFDTSKINPKNVDLYKSLSAGNFNSVQSIYDHSYKIPCHTADACEDYLILDRIFYPSGIKGVYDEK